MIVLLALIWTPVAMGAHVAASVLTDRLRRAAEPAPVPAAAVANQSPATLNRPSAPLRASLAPIVSRWHMLGISGSVTLAMPALVAVAALTAYTYSEVLLLASSASAAAWFVRLKSQGHQSAIALPLQAWTASHAAYVIAMRFFSDAVYARNVGDPTGDTLGFWLDPTFSPASVVAALTCVGLAFAWEPLNPASPRRVIPNVALVASAIACGILAWSTMVFGVLHLTYAVAFAGLAIAHVARTRSGGSARVDELAGEVGAAPVPPVWLRQLGASRNQLLAAALAVSIAGVAVATVPLIIEQAVAATATSLAFAAVAAAFVTHRLHIWGRGMTTRGGILDVATTAFVATMLVGGFLSLPVAAFTGYFDERVTSEAAATFYVLGAIILVLSAFGLLGILVALRRSDVKRWDAARFALVWPAILVSPGAVARHDLHTGFAAADWLVCAVALGAVAWIMLRLLAPTADSGTASRSGR